VQNMDTYIPFFGITMSYNLRFTGNQVISSLIRVISDMSGHYNSIYFDRTPTVLGYSSAGGDLTILHYPRRWSLSAHVIFALEICRCW